LILRVKMIYLNLFATESLVLSKVTLCLQYRVITNSMQHKASREAYSRQKIPRRTGTVFTRAVTCHCPQPKESSPHPHSHIRYILILSYNTQVGLYSAINIRWMFVNLSEHIKTKLLDKLWEKVWWLKFTWI
jgi:hypothetical protein